MRLRRQPPRPRGTPHGPGTLRRVPGRPTVRPASRAQLRWPALPRLALPRVLAALRPVRSGFSPTRAGALLAVLVGGGALYGAGASDAFVYDRLELTASESMMSGLEWTNEADVLELVEVPKGANLFALRTAPIAARIADVPSVAAVRVDVRLPDTIAIRVTERQAILLWRVGEEHYVVDRAGVAFVELDAAGAAATGLPIVVDSRAATPAALGVGRSVDAVDLDAATRLASLTPADIDSTADALAVFVSDANGFVIGTVPAAWSAVFGFYTPNLRTTELIPGQVRLLRSLLNGREAQVELVILADDQNGTYVPRATSITSPAAP